VLHLRSTALSVPICKQKFISMNHANIENDNPTIIKISLSRHIQQKTLPAIFHKGEISPEIQPCRYTSRLIQRNPTPTSRKDYCKPIALCHPPLLRQIHAPVSIPCDYLNLLILINETHNLASLVPHNDSRFHYSPTAQPSRHSRSIQHGATKGGKESLIL